MSNDNERLPKQHFDRYPQNLPKAIKDLKGIKGLDFHSISRTALKGNQNRTTLIEFLPKQIVSLLESISKTVKQEVSVATKKLKGKLKDLKAELKTANQSLVNLETELDEVTAERDAALEQIKPLRKKQRQTADSDKALNVLQGKLARVEKDARITLEKYGRLIQISKQLRLENNSLKPVHRDNERLRDYLTEAEVLLKANNMSLFDVQLSSGITSASDWLAKPTLMRGGKPVPNGNPGTRR